MSPEPVIALPSMYTGSVMGDSYSECLAVFGLDVNATLIDVDNEFQRLSKKLRKDNHQDLSVINRQQYTYDNAYHVLLQHFTTETSRKSKGALDQVPTNHGVVSRKRKSSSNCDAFNEDQITQADVEMPGDRLLSMKEGTKIMDSVANRGDIRYQPYGVPMNLPMRDALEQRSCFELVEVEGNIFNIPDFSIIIHAVNCLGVWGKGFAAEMKKLYPHAHQAYRKYCANATTREGLAGCCLLIPPQKGDNDLGSPPHWIACLFTSIGYGRPDWTRSNPGKDDVPTILGYTEKALIDMNVHISKSKQRDLYPPGALYSPRINSGMFAVPFNSTRRMIQRLFVDYKGTWTVMSQAVDETARNVSD